MVFPCFRVSKWIFFTKLHEWFDTRILFYLHILYDLCQKQELWTKNSEILTPRNGYSLFSGFKINIFHKITRVIYCTYFILFTRIIWFISKTRVMNIKQRNCNLKKMVFPCFWVSKWIFFTKLHEWFITRIIRFILKREIWTKNSEILTAKNGFPSFLGFKINIFQKITRLIYCVKITRVIYYTYYILFTRIMWFI